jgi:hypothetical protein
MTTLDRLRHWNETGIITDAQSQTLAALVRNERFSVYLELNAALYLGVLALVGGVGWTFQVYFTNLGDPFILTTFSALVANFADLLSIRLDKLVPLKQKFCL